MTKGKKVERNQDKLNRLSLDFVSEISKLDKNAVELKKEMVLDGLYEKLIKLGNELGFKEPTYWAEAYDEFEENKPNYESCVAEINFYLFNLVIGRDKSYEGDITRVYKSTHDMYYQTMMFLFVAVSDHFYNVSVLRKDTKND